jgi:hypothetical protein
MSTNEQQKGMAITSLVLGILSIVCIPVGILAGIPAIITGHVARSRACKTPGQYGGLGMAVAGIVMGYVSIVPTVIILTMVARVVPAMSAAKVEIQRVSCVNNLKNIRLDFLLWAQDHHDRFPFNVSTNQGGTFEYCSRTAEGFDANGWRHLLVMSKELYSPNMLVCFADTSKKRATSFASFGAANVSYQIRSGTNISIATPNEILVRCPIHGSSITCDGTVDDGGHRQKR